MREVLINVPFMLTKVAKGNPCSWCKKKSLRKNPLLKSCSAQ